MPLATLVFVPLDAEVEFPDLCCACLRPQPDEWLPLSRRRVKLLDLLMPWNHWLRPATQHVAPVCSSCHGPAVRHRRRLFGAMLALSVVLVLVLVPWAGSLGLDRHWVKPIVGACVLIGLLPLGLVWVLLPPVADLTVRSRRLEFEFRNAEYATLFASANPTARLE